MLEEAKSGASAKKRELGRGALVDSLAPIARPTRTDRPPPYGPQYRQDALWSGGNEALPPGWFQFQLEDGTLVYQDYNLHMSSWYRPLPGIRLDLLGRLVSGCEWYISSLGRSYFVNHNTQTTSWKKPTPERPAGNLTPLCVIEGHSDCIWNLACVGTSYNVMSASDDGSIRQWRRDGRPVGEPWDGNGGGIGAMAMSPDETMVVNGGVDGRVRLRNRNNGKILGDPWEGHNAAVRCLDWSPDARQVASASEDGTIRRWNPDTGQQIAPPIQTGQWVLVVKYSPQGDIFASGGTDNMIRVWSKEGGLLTEIRGHDREVWSLCWTKDGAHIFSGSTDHTIRRWRSIDGGELAVLRGHTHVVRSICLTPDERHLVSASWDCSVRIWNLKTNQQVGDPLWHDDEVRALVIFPDGKCFASAGLDHKIYIWSLEAALKQTRDQVRVHIAVEGATSSGDIFNVSSRSRQQANSRSVARYVRESDFWGDDTTNRTPRRLAPITSSSTLSPRWHNLLNFLHFTHQPVKTSQPIPLHPRRWNFSLFTRPGRIPTQTIDVTPARDEDRYAIAPPTEAEVAAAMQQAGSNADNSSMSQGQAISGAQGSQVCTTGQPSHATQLQNSSPDTEIRESPFMYYPSTITLPVAHKQYLDGGLLTEIRGHDREVWSLCWTKDGAHIFSGSTDHTIRRWRSIDGGELAVLRGHTHVVRSICLTPDERHLVSASWDCSVRIWNLKTNQQVGDPLWHDDEVRALVIFPDGKCFASAGLDHKIYIWSLEAALKQTRDQVRVHIAVEGATSSGDIFNVSSRSRQQANSRSVARYVRESDFWGDDTTNRTPRRLAPITSSSTLSPRWHNLLNFLHFTHQPVKTSQPIPLHPRRWNFSLFTRPGRIPTQTIDVTPARDEDRYAIAPPTEAEVAAAMQQAGSNADNSSMSQGQAISGAQGSQVCTTGQPSHATQLQNSSPDTEIRESPFMYYPSTITLPVAHKQYLDGRFAGTSPHGFDDIEGNTSQKVFEGSSNAKAVFFEVCSPAGAVLAYGMRNLVTYQPRHPL
ncbi:WD40 repeat-like protein [Rhizopogon salebrosus TDB-379]|nr:WD40 repeat-like protein [Rhizopogon salebrosus TDB-379]